MIVVDIHTSPDLPSATTPRERIADHLVCHARMLRRLASDLDDMAHEILTDPDHASVTDEIMALVRSQPLIPPDITTSPFFVSLCPGLQEDAVSTLDRYGREDYWPTTAEFLADALDEERQKRSGRHP